jgi:hypothetical protein
MTQDTSSTNTQPIAPASNDAASKIAERRRILIALGIALIVALATLVVVILPAEYGVDPTGIGAAIGLDRLAPQTDDNAGMAFVPTDEPPQHHRVTFVLPPGRDTEYKLHMDTPDTILFTWSVDNATVYYDFHGDLDASTSGEFVSFDEGDAQESSGSLQAPFSGRHGWYFHNTSDEQVTITLEVWGHYDIIGRLF